jgi:hypothetical protein
MEHIPNNLMKLGESPGNVPQKIAEIFCGTNINS